MPDGETSPGSPWSPSLDDGSRAEDVRFLRAPANLEEMEVDLVELYATVARRRRATRCRGSRPTDFEVLEDGRPQKLARFEQVENLPLIAGDRHRHLVLHGLRRSPRRSGPPPASCSTW